VAGFRSTTSTRAPSSANRWAVARPIPLPAPVTTTRAPVTLLDNVLNLIKLLHQAQMRQNPCSHRDSRTNDHISTKISNTPCVGLITYLTLRSYLNIFCEKFLKFCSNLPIPIADQKQGADICLTTTHKSSIASSSQQRSQPWVS
jgi:hypothetical protein